MANLEIAELFIGIFFISLVGYAAWLLAKRSRHAKKAHAAEGRRWESEFARLQRPTPEPFAPSRAASAARPSQVSPTRQTPAVVDSGSCPADALVNAAIVQEIVESIAESGHHGLDGAPHDDTGFTVPDPAPSYDAGPSWSDAGSFGGDGGSF